MPKKEKGRPNRPSLSAKKGRKGTAKTKASELVHIGHKKKNPQKHAHLPDKHRNAQKRVGKSIL